MSSGNPPWALLVSHVELMVQMQRETLELLKRSLGIGKTTKRQALIQKATKLLKVCGANTTEIAKRLKIKRSTLNGWEEFRKVRDEYARMEAADKAKRARKLTGTSEGDLDPDEGDDE